jgi:arylsulfatase A-like enzyme
MSGQRPSTHGIVGYQDGVEWDAPPTLPGVLRDRGYQTHLVGRSMHLFPPRKRFGFEQMEINCHMGPSDYDEWLAQTGPKDSGGWFGGGVMHNDWPAKPWPLSEHLHFTNWTVTRSLEFLRRRDPTCPFFLVVSFIAPHPPLQPPAFYFERYLRTGVPEPVIGDWAKAPASPLCPYMGESVSPHLIDLKGEAMLSARAGYYGLINHVDDQIRRLLNLVNGVDRMTEHNTAVVFTSDHGEMLGDHHFWMKGLAYEPSARIPLLMRAPLGWRLPQMQVVDQPVTLEDVMPTLLEMAGAEIPSTVEGRSLLPFMKGEKPNWREYVHIEHAPFHQALTDGKEKYIWWTRDGREQLFDLREDPTECHDLIDDASRAERIKLWRGRLIEELRGRPEGFTDGKKLIPGREYKAALPRQ